MTRDWRGTLAAGSVSGVIWAIAAWHGHGIEMIWLPAVVVAAAWPRELDRRRCLARLSSRS